MGEFSGWHWMIVLVFLAAYAAIFMVPIWRILNKAGYSGAWSFLTWVPLVNLVCLWVFAFSSWPVERRQGPQ
ncbi:hypothetical protein G4G28_19150 [Massilia sp. Dwa41.01b]|uniref:hypothetical protein n=1 Tax=unclassified Massilia TaxID=2609279 RepID=UPI001602B68E|nr:MULTISPECIES: hypothetical protein [unclassified Massilia]QNA90082.1 hypothetical protein G4G28_19150 [Massilia sp. Dwa41.01b]QNB00972.1 hypothetical protein G4G31_22755 [Massilia sp. Se16.2.3]